MFLVIGIYSSCFADSFDNGQKAYKSNNYKEAVKFYAKACKEGNAQGCYELGYMYYSGKGIKQDDSKGLQFYNKACDMNLSGSCLYLGFMYLNGDMVKQDNEKAKYFFSRACDLNNNVGCRKLKSL